MRFKRKEVVTIQKLGIVNLLDLLDCEKLRFLEELRTHLQQRVAEEKCCQGLSLQNTWARRDVREHWLSSSPAAIVPEPRQALRRETVERTK